MFPKVSSFIFTVCQLGAEAALKAEIVRNHPTLKFAFSRPGFLTFKSEKPVSGNFELNSIFSRAYGLSFGKIKGSDLPAEVVEIIRQWGDSVSAIHFWERDLHIPGEEPKGFLPGKFVDTIQPRLFNAIRATQPKMTVNPRTAVSNGTGILDLVVVEPEEWWVGYHLHGPFHSPFPGGRAQIDMPTAAPSRAFIKMEEAITWSQAPLKPGDIAVELGSAPGGAVYSLLMRGLKVVGIDPAQMDPKILKHRDFMHIRSPVSDVLREDLPERVDWLVLDMNVSPAISIFAVDRLVTRMKSSLLGVLLTVKLNQWKMAEQIPSMLDHLRAMGISQLRATQLSNNRREIFIYGLTRKGLQRRTNTTLKITGQDRRKANL